MYTAEKGNKVYTITELEKEYYKARGFDIYDENHIKIDSGVHKVDSATYNQALDKIVELEAKVLELSKKGNRRGNNKGNNKGDETSEEPTEEVEEESTEEAGE